MEPSEFLETAKNLLAGHREGDWRSGASRAYYAAFLTFRKLFQERLARELARVNQKKPSHKWVIRVLRACSDPEVKRLGDMLRDLKEERQNADYELGITVSRQRAEHVVGDAKDLLDDMAGVTHAKLVREASASIQLVG